MSASRSPVKGHFASQAALILERVGAQQRPGRQEGQTHGGRLEAHRQCVVGPFRHRHRARLHHPPGVRRQPPGFQSDNVGHIDRGQGLTSAGQVAGAEDLEIVGGRVAGKAQPLLALADDLVQDRGGNAVGPKAADGQVVAIVEQAADSLGRRGQLLDQGPGFAEKEMTSLFR